MKEAPPSIMVIASGNLPACITMRPLNVTRMPTATMNGLTVGKGMGMPSSLAVLRSVSSCIGTACALLIDAASACECSMPAIVPGALRSHRGYREVTSGICAKLYSGGGDGIDHSSVGAPHGSLPARVPCFLLQKKLKAN